MLHRNTTKPEKLRLAEAQIPMERFGSMEVGAGKL